MRFKGWVELVLSYEIDAVNIIDAETKMKSAINRIKHSHLIGLPEVTDWGVEEVNEEEQ